MWSCPEFALRVPRTPFLSQTASPRQACEVHGISKGLGAMAFVFHWIGLGILTWMINHHIADGWRTQERVHSEWMVHAVYSKQLLSVPVSSTLPTLASGSLLLASLSLILFLSFLFYLSFFYLSFFFSFTIFITHPSSSLSMLVLFLFLPILNPLLSYLYTKPMPGSGALRRSTLRAL